VAFYREMRCFFKSARSQRGYCSFLVVFPAIDVTTGFFSFSCRFRVVLDLLDAFARTSVGTNLRNLHINGISSTHPVSQPNFPPIWLSLPSLIISRSRFLTRKCAFYVSHSMGDEQFHPVWPPHHRKSALVYIHYLLRPSFRW